MRRWAHRPGTRSRSSTVPARNNRARTTSRRAPPPARHASARRREVCLWFSLRAGSVAGRRARIVVGLWRSRVGRGFAATALTLCSWRRAFLAGGDAQTFYAPGIGIEHFDLEIAGAGNDFATYRQPADMGDEIAAERLDLFSGLTGHKFLADHGADIVEPGAGVGDEGIIRLPHDRRRLVAVMLVVDFADDLFDDVLDRHQAVGAAIFVHH